MFWLFFNVLLDMLNQLKMKRLTQIHEETGDKVFLRVDSHHGALNMDDYLTLLRQTLRV